LLLLVEERLERVRGSEGCTGTREEGVKGKNFPRVYIWWEATPNVGRRVKNNFRVTALKHSMQMRLVFQYVHTFRFRQNVPIIEFVDFCSNAVLVGLLILQVVFLSVARIELPIRLILC